MSSEQRKNRDGRLVASMVPPLSCHCKGTFLQVVWGHDDTESSSLYIVRSADPRQHVRGRPTRWQDLLYANVPQPGPPSTQVQSRGSRIQSGDDRNIPEWDVSVIVRIVRTYSGGTDRLFDSVHRLLCGNLGALGFPRPSKHPWRQGRGCSSLARGGGKKGSEAAVSHCQREEKLGL